MVKTKHNKIAVQVKSFDKALRAWLFFFVAAKIRIAVKNGYSNSIAIY